MKNKLTKILMGAAIATAAITPVAALGSCNKQTEFEVTVEGAEFDKLSSSLKLNQDSKLVLKPASGYKIKSIETVKVGDTTLTTDDYDYQEASGTLTIKAIAMKSNKIYVKAVVVTTIISWEDGWYVYETHGSGPLYTNYVQAEFMLDEALEQGQTLTFDINVTGHTDPVELLHENVTVDGKKVTIPLRLKTSYAYIRLGSYAIYDITFTCKNGEETIWTKKLSDCYVYVLTTLDTPTVWFGSKAAQHIADLETRTSVNVQPALFTENVLQFKSEITTTKRPADKPTANVVISPGQTQYYKSERNLYQEITVDAGSETLAAGDEFEFTVTFTLTLTAVPTRPVSFTFEGVKLRYQ